MGRGLTCLLDGAAEKTGVRSENRNVGIYFGSQSLSADVRLRGEFLFSGVEPCFAKVLGSFCV